MREYSNSICGNESNDSDSSSDCMLSNKSAQLDLQLSFGF